MGQELLSFGMGEVDIWNSAQIIR